jgi:hypothetical protein
MALFHVLESHDVDGGHVYVRLSPLNPATLADDLAARITGAYLDVDTELQRLREAANELRLFQGEELAPIDAEIAEALAELRDALLPAGWDGRRPKHTDVQRSELAEIVAADVLRSHFATIIPASRVRHKEIPDQQARGADVVGLEDLVGFTDEQPVGSLTLVLSEVKGSTAAASPPSVVADMAEKLRGLASTRRALIQELTWLRDHADDAHAPVCARLLVAFLLKRLDHQTLLAPVLLRAAAVAAATDTGEFETSPESFDPSRIRFISIIVDRDIFELAAEAYVKARAAVQRIRGEAPVQSDEGSVA